VTGSSGFIGSRLVPALGAVGHPVRASSAWLDRENMADERADVIVHLAGLTYVPDSWRDPLSFYQTNVIGTLRVLDHCARNEARLVFISSYVYGPPDHLPISEDAPRRPANPYMHTKVLAEDCCRFYAGHMGVKVLIVRPFNIYGPGQDRRFIIPSLVAQLIDPTIAEVSVADAQPRRDFLYVDDLISLLVAAVASDAEGTVNAGSGRSHSVQEIHSLLLDITGLDKPLVQTGEGRRGEIMDVVAEVSRARELLDWRPLTDLRDGLRATVDAMAGGEATASGS
jgi:nucleoside-diphosphate-sugar epimerase